MPVRGDTQTATVTFYDTIGGAATDPTELSLTILHDGAEYAGPFTVPPVIRDAVGFYRYEWSIPLDAPLGTYTLVWSGVLPGDDAASVGYETVEVTAGVTPTPDYPDFCWPVDTSCIPDWDALTDPNAPAGEDNPPVYSDVEKARAISLAGQAMRMLTGYRVGGCPVTIRPASRRCNERTWRTYVVGGVGSLPWHPVQQGGEWLNIGCGHDGGGCGCSVIHEVQLYAPASSVTQVKVDGIVLDPSAYRLDAGGRLVRTDGDGWPLCQNMTLPDSEPGTWSVTYTPGAAVDGLGAFAAGLLTAEFLSLCTGGQCALPTTVTQVVRQGVTYTLPTGVFPGNRTGIQMVDVYIEAVNPNGLLAAPQVWSPDLPQHRRPG